MTKYKQSFEKCVIKIQRTQYAHKFFREITEITSSINSRVRYFFMNFTSSIFSSKTLVSINKINMEHSSQDDDL